MLDGWKGKYREFDELKRWKKDDFDRRINKYKNRVF